MCDTVKTLPSRAGLGEHPLLLVLRLFRKNRADLQQSFCSRNHAVDSSGSVNKAEQTFWAGNVHLHRVKHLSHTEIHWKNTKPCMEK